MPRSVFRLLWERIQAGHEIFAYVLNRAANGDHYWVFAHVTPTFSQSGEISGYHSNRRSPDKGKINSIIKPLYDELLSIERNPVNRKDGMRSSILALQDRLNSAGVTYDRFVATI